MRRLFPVVGFVVMLTVLNASKPHIDTAVVAAVVAAPVLAVGDGECDIFCQEGAPANCEEGDHDAYYLPYGQWHLYNASTGSGPHNDKECWPDLCEDEHSPVCYAFAAASADLESLRASLARASVRDVRNMLAKHEAHYVVNTERSAIQILNCTGDAVAHFPIPGALTRDLSAAE